MLYLGVVEWEEEERKGEVRKKEERGGRGLYLGRCSEMDQQRKQEKRKGGGGDTYADPFFTYYLLIYYDNIYLFICLIIINFFHKQIIINY